MFSSEAFSFINFKRDRVSNSFSPFAFLIVFNDVFKKLVVFTPEFLKDIETLKIFLFALFLQ